MYLCFFFLCVCSRCCMFVWEFPLSLTGAPVGDALYIGICFYPPISIPPPPLLFVSCLSCLRHCHTIPHMMQYLKWHKNKWINEQMKDEQEKPIETLHSCSSKGIMCSAPRCSICNQNCDLKDWCCQTRQTKTKQNQKSILNKKIETVLENTKLILVPIVSQ